MTEDTRNPFSQIDSSGSQGPDFKVNQFSSEQARFPQFGNPHIGESTSHDDIKSRIEAAKSNGWGSLLSGFIKSHRNKILVVVAMLLLFAGGAYISGKGAGGGMPNFGKANLSGNIAQSDNGRNPDSKKSDSDSSAVNVLDIKINKDGEVIFDKEEGPLAPGVSSITKTAQAGDGITHLARRALADYLSETGKTLRAEQKVYAEDYVQNATGDEWLEVGQKLSFSRDLLRDAVNKAGGLQDWQIENLKQYTA